MVVLASCHNVATLLLSHPHVSFPNFRVGDVGDGRDFEKT